MAFYQQLKCNTSLIDCLRMAIPLQKGNGYGFIPKDSSWGIWTENLYKLKIKRGAVNWKKKTKWGYL